MLIELSDDFGNCRLIDSGLITYISKEIKDRGYAYDISLYLRNLGSLRFRFIDRISAEITLNRLFSNLSRL